jgi:hypothetical protein
MIVLKGEFQTFDPLNRNPYVPYWQDPVVPKSLTRLRKIKKIFNFKF